MSTNHGGVAVVSMSGVRLMFIALGVDHTFVTMVLIYRPGSEAITTTFLSTWRRPWIESSQCTSLVTPMCVSIAMMT